MSDAFDAASQIITAVADAVEWLMDTIEGDDDVYLQHVDPEQPTESMGGFCPPETEDDIYFKMNEGKQVHFLDTYDQYFRFPLDKGPVTIELREYDKVKGDVCLGAFTIDEDRYDELIDQGAQVEVACEYLDGSEGEGAVYYICYSVALENWAEEPNQENMYGDAPFDTDVTLVTADSFDDWASQVLGIDGSDLKHGGPLEQGCIMNGSGYLMFAGPTTPVDMVSYIAVAVEDENATVEIELSPPNDDGESKYYGWNGSSWEPGGAVLIDGLYWYRHHVKWSSSSSSDYEWVATSYKDGQEKVTTLQVWAYHEDTYGSAPTDTDLELVTSTSFDGWCSQVLGIDGSDLRHGGPMEGDSIMTGSGYLFFSGPVTPVDMVSYISVDVEDEDATVEVELSPPTDDGEARYYGWNGTSWVQGDAVKVDGVYWYRLHVKWASSLDSDFEWKATSYKDGDDKVTTVRVQAYREK